MKNVRRFLKAIKALRKIQRHIIVSGFTSNPYKNSACYDEEHNLFRFRGSWHDIGVAYSENVSCSSFVAGTAHLMSRIDDPERRLILSAMDRALDRLNQIQPGLIEFLRGVAAGSGLPYEDVALANLVTTLVPLGEARDNCSALAVLGSSGPIIGQNLDLGPRNDTALALIEADGAIPFVAHMNPGTIWFTTGINVSGVTYAGASVNADGIFARCANATPIPLVALFLLSRANSVSDAISLLEKALPFGPPNDGASLIIADPKRIALVELTGELLTARDGTRLVATNDFVLGSPMSCEDDVAELLSHSLLRRSCGNTAVHSLLNPESVGEFLRSEMGPGAWCRSGRFPDLGWTTASYVIDLGGQTIDSWHGPAPLRPARKRLMLSEVFSGHPQYYGRLN